ncbi:MAG: dephospho-CoA kinase [Caulobacterales bacterium]
MIIIGLTGSIGMGKSATLALFAEQGCAVYDADAAVHALYAKGGAAVAPVEAAFPGVTKDGAIDRAELSARVIGKPDQMRLLESIVHPLVRISREQFMAKATTPVAVLDIPLLFEGGGDDRIDTIVVCSAPVQTQLERALQRPNLPYEKLAAIISKQTPDWEKRAGADYVVDTSRGEADAREQVISILNHMNAPGWRPRAKQSKTHS